VEPVQHEFPKTNAIWNHEKETEWRKSISWNWLTWSRKSGLS